ncbi:MAG TPA: hypothetical protein PK677_16365 [Acidiphilium sp.]|nr:hypothetical protein [Acidiphilium sp.]
MDIADYPGIEIYNAAEPTEDRAVERAPAHLATKDHPSDPERKREGLFLWATAIITDEEDDDIGVAAWKHGKSNCN